VPAGGFGRGGRSSTNGLKVAVFGATGFLGRYVCNELGKVGSTVYIGNRGCEMETRHLRPMFDLGNAAYYFYHGRDEGSIREIMEGANVVVNLVGKQIETKGLVPVDEKGHVSFFKGSRIHCTYHEANAEIPGLIAKCAAETASVEQLVHVSSTLAAPDSPSEWARAKFAGEEAVKAAYPDATIVRAATLFGHEDKFLNWYALMNGWFWGAPLVEDGSALVQPVYVGDVAKAIMQVIEANSDQFEFNNGEAFAGKTLELAGPAEYTRAEVAAFVKDVAKQGQNPLPVPKPLLRFIASQVEKLWNPYLTTNDVEVMSLDNVLDPANPSGAVTFADLGMTPTPMEAIAFQYLHRYRMAGHFVYSAGYH